MKLPPHFVLKKSTEIKELSAVLHQIEHVPTGAQILHLANDDTENLFCLSFQTLPSSSNGAAHILEHTVLCGSKKFPIKDPFFAMDGRSLNTYMNALTGSDFTCYPASSQVEKDFYNLLEVYLDAVFHPELKKMSFLQEGHRLEFQNESDPTSPLIYKGIVFNEMKGSLGSPETRLWHIINEHLLPNLPYAYNSGGDPKVIPDLTYEELVDFHKTYYHPSRCLFYFYGNLPTEKHLKFIEENALKGVVKVDPIAPIEKQKRFDKAIRCHERYPATEGDLSRKTFVAFGWLTCDVKNQADLLALGLLESVLMDTDASPLKLALTQSGLCIEADGYMDAEMSEIPYMVICRGSEAQHADALEEVLRKTLERLCDEGVDRKLVDSSLHQLEFHRLEIQGDHGPFGLTLFFRSALAMQHGADPISGLLTYTHYEELLEKVKDPHYLPQMIRRYFLDNPHFIRVIMEPDPKLSEREGEEEKKRLQEIESHLTESDKQKIVQQAKELKLFQEELEEQEVDCLPKISIEDVPSEIKSFPLEVVQDGRLIYHHHTCFTNHIVYADLVFDLPDLSAHELPYFSLMTNLLSDLGCADRSYLDNLLFMQTYLGGFAANGSLNPQYEDVNAAKPTFSLRGKALARNEEKLFQILRETVLSPRLDEKERIKELILQQFTALQSRLNRNPLTYAIMESVAGFTTHATIKNISYGFRYYQFLERMAQDIDVQIDRVMEELNQLKEKVFHLNSPQLILSCDKESFDRIQKAGAYGLCDLPEKPFKPWVGDVAIESTQSHARCTASPVAFTAFGVHTISVTHPHSAALSLATEIMDNKVLHKRIREQGGAYGGGSNYNPMSGNFTCYGYRDPHIESTRAAFMEGFEAIAAGQFGEDDLEESKLQHMQVLDSPTSPGARASAEYFALLEGKSIERRQKWRDDLLAVDKKMIQKAVAEHLLKKAEEGVTVIFAGKPLLEKEKCELPILSLTD